MRISPSALPGLEACPGFRGGGPPGPEAQRGTDIDALLSRLLAGEVLDVPDLWLDSIEYGQEMWSDIRKTMPGAYVLIHPIVSVAGIKGTADAALVDLVAKVGAIVDWKTGRSHGDAAGHLQLLTYAWALMEQYELRYVDAYIVGLDLRETTHRRLLAEECPALYDRVASVIEKAEADDPTTYVNGRHCKWCTRRNSCEEGQA